MAQHEDRIKLLDFSHRREPKTAPPERIFVFLRDLVDDVRTIIQQENRAIYIPDLSVRVET